MASNGSRNVWSEQYVSGYNNKHIWHFYNWGFSSIDSSYSYAGNGRQKFDVYLEYWPSTTGQRPVDFDGSRYRWWTGNNWSAVWFENEWDEPNYNSPIYSTRWYYQDPVYTYYYYRYVDKESTTEINPSSTISGIIHWVKYIPKNANEFSPQEFDALILHKESQKPIESHDGNVIVGTENRSIGRYQTWHFTRNDDGTYKIASHADGKVIDLEGSSTVNETNISMYSAHGENNQRWYLQEYNGGYNLVPKCSPIGVMDLTGGKTDDFTNVQFYQYNGTSAQTFSIRIIPDLEAYLAGTD